MSNSKKDAADARMKIWRAMNRLGASSAATISENTGMDVCTSRKHLRAMLDDGEALRSGKGSHIEWTAASKPLEYIDPKIKYCAEILLLMPSARQGISAAMKGKISTAMAYRLVAEMHENGDTHIGGWEPSNEKIDIAIFHPGFGVDVKAPHSGVDADAYEFHIATARQAACKNADAQALIKRNWFGGAA